MIAAPVLAVLPSNPALALFLALGAFIYVIIYTIWLKPRTPLNIVIGGAAGSAAVLAGGAAAHAWTDPGVIALAILLFFWTPIHFWALALVYREDYARARVPMLPVTSTPRAAAFWGFAHGVGAAAAGIGMAFLPYLGLVYTVPVLVMTTLLLWQSAALIVEPTKRRAFRVFHTSNFYLFVVLLAAIIGSMAPVRW
jgi:protoheme IX farnesyltransferase